MKHASTRLNPEQRLVAETFGRPIAAMAGAGSGKTFTLVERIVNAFDADVVGDDALTLEGIDEVLAITFTEKAANELKSRIRSGLKVAGKDEQALLVDDAWISTIHSMCRRILAESALDLGIDPNFKVLEADDAEALLDEVMEYVLAEDETVREQSLALLEEYDRGYLKAFIHRLVDKASQSAMGFESLTFGPREVAIQGLGTPDEAGDSAVDGAGPQAGPRGSMPAASSEWIDEELRFLGLEGTEDERRTYLLMNRRLAQAAELREPLATVVRRVQRLFREEKLDHGVFDNNDLLVETYRALRNDAVLERYRDKFKLVIVDEFQDTDMLQLGIIRALSGEDDRRLSVVGDVKQSIYRFRGADLYVSQRHVGRLEEGDARDGTQSVFDMGTNYRSHGSILEFTNLLFSDDPSNPTEPKLPFPYKGLSHGRDEAQALAFDEALEGPRIEVVEAQYIGNKGTDARNVCAHHIAERFKAIHDAGRHGYGSMVILLNSMTNAGTYAQALEDQGIPCAVTGGSVFKNHDVPKLLVQLVRLFGNPLADAVATVVLESELFGFDPEDFLNLAEVAGLAKRAGRSVPVGESLATCLGRRSGSKVDDRISAARPKVRVALDVLGRAFGRIGFERISDLLADVLYDSGWLTRKSGWSRGASPEGPDVRGMAAAADALKLIRMARDLEDEGVLGPRELSVRLGRRLEMAATPPGILATDSNEFVRIMTIHASKGLEYPVVAIGELAPHNPRGIGVGLAVTSEGRTHVLLDLSRSEQALDKGLREALKSGGVRKRLLAQVRSVAHRLLGDEGGSGRLDERGLALLVDEADRRGDLALRFLALLAYEEDAEKAELMRKAYVALTRAREALVLCVPVPVSAGKRDEGLVDLLGSRAALKKLKTPERNLSVLPDVRPIHEDNEVAARVQRRREAIEAMGAYRLVPFAFSRKHAEDGIYPAVLADAGWEGEAGQVLAAEHPEAAAENPRELPAFEVPQDYAQRPMGNHRYYPMAAEGIFSASSLKRDGSGAHYDPPDEDWFDGEDEAGEVEPPAYAKGLAFHELCQRVVLDREEGRTLDAPDVDRIQSVCRRYRLSDVQTTQVGNALRSWFASKVARKLVAHSHIEAEVPFFVSLDDPDSGDATGIQLSGFIDLLAHDGKEGGAPHIVDYKTGWSYRTQEERERAYRVQAMVYAYAVLLQGFATPRVTFALVEQRDDGELATCEFPPKGERWTLESVRGELLAKIDALSTGARSGPVPDST